MDLAIIVKRLSLGVLEIFQKRTAGVLLACLLALTVIFLIDVRAPPDVALYTLYLVPAAIAAAVLPRTAALGTWLAAVGLQVVAERFGRASVTTILVQALALAGVVMIVRLRRVSRVGHEDAKHQPPAIQASVEATSLARLENQFGMLTRREREVAELAAVGRSAKEIANELRIGRRTVETHLGRAYAKLGVQSRVGLILRQNGHRSHGDR